MMLWQIYHCSAQNSFLYLFLSQVINNKVKKWRKIEYKHVNLRSSNTGHLSIHRWSVYLLHMEQGSNVLSSSLSLLQWLQALSPIVCWTKKKRFKEQKSHKWFKKPIFYSSEVLDVFLQPIWCCDFEKYKVKLLQ